MKHSLTYLLSELALYAKQNDLLREEDEAYVMNGWLTLMRGTELTEEKVMGDKVVFRGSALGHVLLRNREGQLKSWDFEIPFSQYAQLDRDYGPEATADPVTAVTNLEMELLEGGRLRLKAGIVSQYLVYDRDLIRVVLDAYSPNREVKPELTMLNLPALLEQTEQTFPAQRPWEQENREPVDLSFLLSQPAVNREGEKWMLDFAIIVDQFGL